MFVNIQDECFSSRDLALGMADDKQPEAIVSRSMITIACF